MKIINLQDLLVGKIDSFEVKKESSKTIIRVIKDGIFLININEAISELKIIITKNCSITEKFELKSNSKMNIEYQVEKNINFKHAILNIESISDLEITHIVELEDNSNFQGVAVEVSESNINSFIKINLNGKNTSSYYRLAAVSDNVKKKYSIYFNHLKENSSSNMDNYGVSKLAGKLIIEGTGKIVKGAINSKANQTSRVLLFDDSSIGEINPILLIDESEVEAGHAASLGQVDENHLFYLTSRGLSMLEARNLISKGYLFPVLEYLDIDIKKYVYDALVRKAGI